MSLRLNLVVTITMLMAMGSAFAAESACYPFNKEFKGAASVTISGNPYPLYFKSTHYIAQMTEELVEVLGLRVIPNGWRGFNRVSGEVFSSGFVEDFQVDLFGSEIEMKSGSMGIIPNKGQAMYISTLLFPESLMMLNYPESEVCFLDKDKINLEEFANINANYDKQFRELSVEVTVNGKDLWLGFAPSYLGGILLDKKIAESLTLPGPKLDADTNRWNDTLNGFVIGPYELTGIPVEYLEAQRGRGRLYRSMGTGGVRVSGLVGFEVLKHFAVVIDAYKNQMFIEAGASAFSSGGIRDPIE